MPNVMAAMPNIIGTTVQRGKVSLTPTTRVECRALTVPRRETRWISWGAPNLVALVRIQNAGLKCAARGSLKIQDTKNRHLGTIAQLCPDISSQLSSNISSTCPHNMVDFGTRAAEIGSGVWGTPANFNGIRVLAALLHGTPVLGVSQTLRRWIEGANYIRQGGHHVGHCPHF